MRLIDTDRSHLRASLHRFAGDSAYGTAALRPTSHASGSCLAETNGARTQIGLIGAASVLIELQPAAPQISGFARCAQVSPGYEA